MTGKRTIDLHYPSAAYAPNGVLWWELTVAPGSRSRAFGDERKLAAYLAFHVRQGGRFTMRSLRAALGASVPNSAEHLNRRLRQLRTRDGWVLQSQRDSADLALDEYRVAKIGWHPGCGFDRPVDDKPSESMRRRVHERDSWMCVVCGIGAREEYDDEPGKTARLTLGHRIPGARLGKETTVEDLQSECARCNEPVRDELPNPLTLQELMPGIRSMSQSEKKELLRRIRLNRRPQTRVDEFYTRVRRLSDSERSQLVAALEGMAGC
ncbi:HNH endonuclease [Geodermatophilus sp. SYSU D00814]